VCSSDLTTGFTTENTVAGNPIEPTADTGEIALDIIRETARGSSVLSRYCSNVRTQEVAYYCEVSEERVAIHRGDGNGPVIAATDSFHGKDGITEIEMVETSSVVPFRHKHPSLPLMSGYAAFRVNGKQYEWKKHRQLKESGSDVVLATFEASEDKESNAIGRLTITEAARDSIDFIVVTCLIDQERGEEGKYKGHEAAVQP